MGKGPGPGGGGSSHSRGTRAVTLQPSGSAGHRRAPAESCRQLHPAVLRGEGAAPATNPGAGAAGPLAPCRGDRNRMGLVARTRPAALPQPSSPQPSRAQPVPCGGEWLPTAARPALTPAGARSSPRVRPSYGSRGAAASRCGPGDSLFPAAWLQGFLPFPRRGMWDTPSRGTFCSFLPCRVCGENRRERRLRSAPLPSIMSQGQAGLPGAPP